MATKDELLQKYRKTPSSMLEKPADENNFVLENPTSQPADDSQLTEKQKLLQKYSKTDKVKPKENKESFFDRKGTDFWIGTPEEMNTSVVDRAFKAIGQGLARTASMGQQFLNEVGQASSEVANFAGVPQDRLLNREALNQSINDLGIPNPSLPVNEDWRKLYDEKFGKPQGPFENFLSNFTNAAATGGAMPGPLMLKPLLGGAVGETFGQEAGFSEGGQAATGIFGSIAPSIYETVSNPRQAVTNLVRFFNKGASSPAQQQVIAAGQRQGIVPNAANVTNNPFIKKVSQLVAGKKGVGGAWVKQTDKQFADAFLKNVTKDPKASYQKTVAAGSNAVQEMNEAFKNSNKALNSRYGDWKNTYRNIKTTPDEIADAVNEIASNLGNIAEPSSDIGKLLARVNDRIYETVNKSQMVFDPASGQMIMATVPAKQLRELSFAELLDIRTDLGELYRQSRNFFGPRQMKFDVRNSVNEVIERSNPQAHRQLRELDAAKTELYDTYGGNRAVARVMDADTGTAAVKAVKNPEEYAQFAKALGSSTKGQQILDQWNQAKLEEIFKNVSKTARNGNVNQQTLLDMMNDPQTAAWFDVLTTPEQRKNLSDIFTLSDNFINGAINIEAIAGNSKNGIEALKVASLGNAIGELMKGKPISALMNFAPSALSAVFARMWIDPQFQQDLIRAAQQPTQRAYINVMRSALKRAGLFESVMKDRTDSEQEQ